MSEFVDSLDEKAFADFDTFGQQKRLLVKKDVPIWKMKKGENAIMILPPIREEEFIKNPAVWKAFGIVIYNHPNMTPNGDMFPCVNVMRGEKCPFCEQFKKINDWDEKKIYKPRMKGAIWVVDMSSQEEMAKGAQLWLFGWVEDIFPSLRDAIVDPETKKPYNIFKQPRIIYFRTRERNDKYNSLVMLTPRVGHKTYDKKFLGKFLDGVRPFSEIINWPTKEELAQFYDVPSEEDIELPVQEDEFDDIKDDIDEELLVEEDEEEL